MNFMSSAVETSYDTESMKKISPLRCYAPPVEMTREREIGRDDKGVIGRDDK